MLVNETAGYAIGLECTQCEAKYPLNSTMGMCECGGPFFTRYDLSRMKAELKPSDLLERPSSMFRFLELLPVLDESKIVTLGEGGTPLLPAHRLASRLGLNQVLIKDEGINPTGTFKARGAALGVTRLLELDVEAIVIPT